MTCFRPSMCARWLVPLLLALTLFARVIVPAGFMPMAGHAGLEICAGQTAMPDMPGMDHHKGAPIGGDHDCPFASIGGAADLPALPVPPIPVLVPAVAPSLARLMIQPGRGLAAPPPPSTGPPTLLR